MTDIPRTRSIRVDGESLERFNRSVLQLLQDNVLLSTEYDKIDCSVGEDVCIRVNNRERSFAL